jgi:hypothetical protein
MLDVLATLSQGKHLIFSKEYVPPQKPQQSFSFDIDNADGFFTGLPRSKFKGRVMTASILMTPEQRLMQKTLKLEARLQKARDQLEKVSGESAIRTQLQFGQSPARNQLSHFGGISMV